MLLPDELGDESLIRYLRGACSPDELDAIERWADESAAHRKQLGVLRRAWAASSKQVSRGDVDKGWAAIAAQLHEPAQPRFRREPSPQVLRVLPAGVARPRWFHAARAAGIVLAVGVASLLVWMSRRHGTFSPVTPAGAMRDITTRAGQRADVYLSDGTHVVLGVASRLRFPASFGASRDVELQGQAYFDVVHDEARSFAVHTARAVVRDIGTKFDVRAYAKSENTVVAVTEGAVVLKPTSGPRERIDSLILTQRRVGFVSPDGSLATRGDADADALAAWVAGKLVFQQTPAAEAVAQLNRWYGADVRLGDSTLVGYALTMSITNESLPEAVGVLARALDARIEDHDSTVVLYARNSR